MIDYSGFHINTYTPSLRHLLYSNNNNFFYFVDEEKILDLTEKVSESLPLKQTAINLSQQTPLQLLKIPLSDCNNAKARARLKRKMLYNIKKRETLVNENMRFTTNCDETDNFRLPIQKLKTVPPSQSPEIEGTASEEPQTFLKKNKLDDVEVSNVSGKNLKTFSEIEKKTASCQKKIAASKGLVQSQFLNENSQLKLSDYKNSKKRCQLKRKLIRQQQLETKTPDFPDQNPKMEFPQLSQTDHQLIRCKEQILVKKKAGDKNDCTLIYQKT